MLLVAALVSLASLDVVGADAKLFVDTSKIQGIESVDLFPSYQGPLPSEPTLIDAGLGPAPFFLYTVPDLGFAYEIAVISNVVDRRVFYPIFVLLDENRRAVKELRLPALTESKPFERIAVPFRVPVDVTVRYLAITTDPSLYGKPIAHTAFSTSTVPIYSGNSVIYVPGPSTPYNVELVFSDAPNLEIRIPTPHETSPTKVQKGYFTDFGVTFGGDRVASNPDGDAYNAGSGAVIGLGYSEPIAFHHEWHWRIGGAFRYQGGDGTSQGILLNGSIVYARRLGNLGVGVYGDLHNEVKATDGTRTEFKDAAGLMLFGEWRVNDQFNLGARYVKIDYESTTGTTYSGDQGALYVLVWF